MLSRFWNVSIASRVFVTCTILVLSTSCTNYGSGKMAVSQPSTTKKNPSGDDKGNQPSGTPDDSSVVVKGTISMLEKVWDVISPSSASAASSQCLTTRCLQVFELTLNGEDYVSESDVAISDSDEKSFSVILAKPISEKGIQRTYVLKYLEDGVVKRESIYMPDYADAKVTHNLTITSTSEKAFLVARLRAQNAATSATGIQRYSYDQIKKIRALIKGDAISDVLKEMGVLSGKGKGPKDDVGKEYPINLQTLLETNKAMADQMITSLAEEIEKRFKNPNHPVAPPGNWSALTGPMANVVDYIKTGHDSDGDGVKDKSDCAPGDASRHTLTPYQFVSVLADPEYVTRSIPSAGNNNNKLCLSGTTLPAGYYNANPREDKRIWCSAVEKEGIKHVYNAAVVPYGSQCKAIDQRGICFSDKPEPVWDNPEYKFLNCRVQEINGVTPLNLFGTDVAHSSVPVVDDIQQDGGNIYSLGRKDGAPILVEYSTVYDSKTVITPPAGSLLNQLSGTTANRFEIIALADPANVADAKRLIFRFNGNNELGIYTPKTKSWVTTGVDRVTIAGLTPIEAGTDAFSCALSKHLLLKDNDPNSSTFGYLISITNGNLKTYVNLGGTAGANAAGKPLRCFPYRNSMIIQAVDKTGTKKLWRLYNDTTAAVKPTALTFTNVANSTKTSDLYAPNNQVHGGILPSIVPSMVSDEKTPNTFGLGWLNNAMLMAGEWQETVNAQYGTETVKGFYFFNPQVSYPTQDGKAIALKLNPEHAISGVFEPVYLGYIDRNYYYWNDGYIYKIKTSALNSNSTQYMIRWEFARDFNTRFFSSTSVTSDDVEKRSLKFLPIYDMDSANKIRMIFFQGGNENSPTYSIYDFTKADPSKRLKSMSSLIDDLIIDNKLARTAGNQKLKVININNSLYMPISRCQKDCRTSAFPNQANVRNSTDLVRINLGASQYDDLNDNNPGGIGMGGI